MDKIFVLMICLVLAFSSCSKEDSSIIEPKPPTTGLIPADIAVDSIQEFNQILSGESEASRLGLSFYFSDFEPTGVYLKPNSTLKLNVTLLAGSDYPELLVGTYSRGTSWNIQPEVHYLKKGINTIYANNEGGMVYIRFISESDPKGKIKIEFQEGWEHSPLYKYKQTSNLVWKKMLQSFKDVPSVTLIGNKEFLVVSRDKAIEYQNKDQDDLLKTIDEIITVQNDLSGMDGSEEMHKPMSHKLLMVEYTGDEYYMFAYWYRTAYRNTDAVKYILDPLSIRQDGWGPWHEIGHMHQMKAWTWSEIVETTVNLYSLKTEKHFGISPSRLNRENKWEEIKTYLSQAEDTKDFNASSTSVWVRLGMFYQLQLAYGDRFYQELHKLIRKENPIINNDEDKMRTFMLAACHVSGKDLSGFFKKWGLKFTNSDEVYKEIASLWLTEPESDISEMTE